LKTYNKHIFFTLLLVSFQLNSIAQLDTLKSVQKPRIGFGTGTLTYFGEVQNYQIGGYSALTNRIGGSIYLNAPLTRSFNIEFSTMYGKIGANERSLVRNLNFESRIRSGSMMLQYNFYQVFPKLHPIFNPYIGVGITSFEFLSKTDIYDKNGNQYFYWSDGSIMNIDENSPLANTAVPLYRDYIYETDLREQNFDSLGKYKEQSFAIPISIGGEWHLSPRLDFRLSTTINYTFTDLIDNISPAGKGLREGDSKNDYYMYTSASLSYDLKFGNGSDSDDTTDVFDGLEENEFDQSDLDHDGVIDALDDCPKTPLEAIVDEHGCPIDTDKDGVADYCDEEENTPIGNYVDKYGVTISEETFRRQQEIFCDSTGLIYDFDKDFYHKDYRDKYGNIVKAIKDDEVEKSYVVVIGKEHKNISANELHKYLGYNDFKTITKGDTVYYVLGEYNNIEDAIAAKTSLESEGIDIKLIGKSNHNGTELSEIDKKIVDKIEKLNYETGKELPTFDKPDQVYRVQVGAFKNKIDANKLYPKMSSLVYATGEDGITRYYSGNYDNYDDAEAYRKVLVTNGYKSSFVVAYEEHERVTLKEAGVKLPPNYNEKEELATFVEPRGTNSQSDGNENGSIDMSKVKYHVLLGKFESEIPVETIDIYMAIGGIRPVKNEDGSTSYYSRSVQTTSDAESLQSDYQTYGLNNLEIIYEYKGKYYTKSEFSKLK